MSDGLRELVILAQHLESAGLGTTSGLKKTIFVNRMPADVKRAILIRQDYLGILIVPELPGYYKTTFQVIVRAPEMDTGIVLAKQLSDVLTLERSAIDEMVVNYMRPRHKPIPYPASQGDQFEVLVNVDACYLLA